MKTKKACLQLVPAEAMFGMAEAFEDGANKRSAYNWEISTTATEWSVADRVAAIMRHALKLHMGQDIDEDSGLHHAAHIMANAAMLYTRHVRGNKIGVDDRASRFYDKPSNDYEAHRDALKERQYKDKCADWSF